MRRLWLLILLLAAPGVADDRAAGDAPEAKPKPKPAPAEAARKPEKKGGKTLYRLRYGMREGGRYIGSNTVAFALKTTVKTGPNQETVTEESVERTERFRDHVKRYSERGLLEMDREYQRLFTKVRASARARPDVDQSPLQGARVTISEKRRRRAIRAKGGMTIPVFVRKTVGMEIDWRDVLPREPVAVGDIWEADAEAVARRIAPYLDSGSRSHMTIRFEGVDEHKGHRIARFYIDWRIQGMRDKQLYTKAMMAGDARFDLDLQRFTLIDIAGSFSVTGAIIGNGKVKIIESEGKVLVKSTLAAEAVSAAAPEEEDSNKTGAKREEPAKKSTASDDAR